eukprot:365632-Chlamydomonas_euryale.AAC.9
MDRAPQGPHGCCDPRIKATLVASHTCTSRYGENGAGKIKLRRPVVSNGTSFGDFASKSLHPACLHLDSKSLPHTSLCVRRTAT